MIGRLQNEDHKSEAELIALGADKTHLLNDVKIYVTADAINKTLYQAIVDNDIGGGGGSVDFNKVLVLNDSSIIITLLGNLVTRV